jgi:two-component system OmpR family response regulator
MSGGLQREEPMVQLRVLIIDDDPSIAQTLSNALHANSMATLRVSSGAEALDQVATFAPHVALLDLSLPDINGIDLISRLRARHDCGIIIITGNHAEAERIVGLEVGADDYLNKPPPLRELVARIRAVRRRVAAGPASAAPPELPHPPTRRYRVGSLSVDLGQSRVTASDGRVVIVTGTEFEVLRMLLLAEGRPVSRRAISLEVLRREWHAEDRSVDQLIFQLRAKLVPEDRDHVVIQTIRSEGYRMVASPIP